MAPRSKEGTRARASSRMVVAVCSCLVLLLSPSLTSIFTGLTIHKDIFKFQKNKTVNVIKEEKRKYILQKIVSSNSSKELFKTFNDLIGKKKNNSLPVDVPKNELPNTFNVFFTDKVEKRIKLDQIPTQTFFKKYRGPTLSSFAPVTEEYVRKIISKCKKKF